MERLRAAGHDVYDFRNPEPGNNGFHWSEIAPAWKDWTPGQFRSALEHPIAQRGFGLDMHALRTCDACVLVLPCGRSAHLEMGWAAGAGKHTAVLLAPGEPELMLAVADQVCLDLDEVVEALVADDAPYVCPGCHTVGGGPCAPGCIDAEIEAERERRADDEECDEPW